MKKDCIPDLIEYWYGGIFMNLERLQYSFIKELERKNTKICAADYGVDAARFQAFVYQLQKDGYISNVHLAPDSGLDLKKADITYTGMKYLAEHFEWIMPYRDAMDRKVWIEQS